MLGDIRRGFALKKAETKVEAAPAAEAGAEGLAASLALIRKGSTQLKPVSREGSAPIARQPSSSLASVLRRRLAERKVAMGDNGDADDGEEADEEWA